MKETAFLLKQLPEGLFTLFEANARGVSRYYVQKLVAEELIYELRRGMYQRAEGSRVEENIRETALKVATLKLKQKSAICLWSALSYYGLTEQVPSLIWAIVPYPYDSKYVKPVRLKNPRWDIGVEDHDGFSMTSIERTIVDSFLFSRYVPVSDAFAALELALRENRTTLKKILVVAEALDAKDKILPFVEIAVSRP